MAHEKVNKDQLIPKQSNGLNHGWYSPSQHKECGAYNYLNKDNKTVKVTQVATQKNISISNYKDYTYVGIVTSYVDKCKCGCRHLDSYSNWNGCGNYVSDTNHKNAIQDSSNIIPNISKEKYGWYSPKQHKERGANNY